MTLRAVLAAALIAAPVAAADRPSFVFFLVDDLGWADVGAYNPDTFYETPHVDRLAARGMRFTNGYAASPVCSPTRYSIMTGRYPSRVDATDWFTGTRTARFLPAELRSEMPLAEITVAEALRDAGYATGFVGKWHLGPDERYWPERQGFGFNAGGHDRGYPRSYFSPYDNPRLADGPEGEHLTARLTEEAIGFIRSRRSQPFFLFLAYYTVHTPLDAPADLVAKYRERAEALSGPEFAEEEQVWPTDEPRRVRILQSHATYAAMVESMDRSVGRVVAALDRLGLSEETVIVFMSDNGGLATAEGSPTSNLPLRGGKGWLYEGGVREPLIVAWPGVTAGGRSDLPVISTDFYPTILDIAGVPPRPEQHLDGVSLAPLLRGEGEPPARRSLYWHYPHYSNQGGFPGGAIRAGRWKLIERYEDGRTHLYDLEEDLGERRDLAARMPERVAELRGRLHDWYRRVGAKFLRPEPGGPEPWRPADP